MDINILLWKLTEKCEPQKFERNEVAESHNKNFVLRLCALWNWDDRLDVAGVIPQSFQLQAQATKTSEGHVTISDSMQSCMCVDHCVCAVRAVQVRVLVCLRSSGYHVTGVGGL